MRSFITIFFLLSTNLSFAQGPGSATNPSTAPGAKGIHLTNHNLIWENPSAAIYNEVYFSNDSLKVANLDTAVRVQNGYPATASTSFHLSAYGNLTQNTRYYWRVVEFDGSGNSVSPVWYFTSLAPFVFFEEFTFATGWDGWVVKGPQGLNNWDRKNTANAGGQPGEMVFFWTPIFNGKSYIMSPEIPSAANLYLFLSFKYFLDWWSDTCVVGFAYTLDDGNSWTSIWELHATGNVGPSSEYLNLYIPGSFRLGFYYKGNTNNIDFFYFDNVNVSSMLTPPGPPTFLSASAHYDVQKVTLNWDTGFSPEPIAGYQIQRKKGLPADTTTFVTIHTANSNTFTYEDYDVDLNQTYSYRVCTVSSAGILSYYGNESTAYVPEVIPVELVSFTASVIDRSVKLSWITASEINNLGFEIERADSYDPDGYKIGEFNRIGFVEGNGTSTSDHSYSFIDNTIYSGKYLYRLKQIDFDGAFTYSNEIEADVNIPLMFLLEQNYPNPFNSGTIISWQSPVSSFQTLKVYDLLGREVASLVNEYKEAGSHSVEFSTVSFNLLDLTSGVYFYRLTAGEYTDTKKFILMK